MKLHDWLGITVSQLVRATVSTDHPILDIGLVGKHRFLLPEFEMDGVGIDPPFIRAYKLDGYYRHLEQRTPSDLFLYRYRYYYGAAIISGLSQLEMEVAHSVVHDACKNSERVFLAVELPCERIKEEFFEQQYPWLKFYGSEGDQTLYVKKGT